MKDYLTAAYDYKNVRQTNKQKIVVTIYSLKHNSILMIHALVFLVILHLFVFIFSFLCL